MSGLKQLDRAFRLADKETQKELRREMYHAAKIVSDTARGIAEFNGLRDSGRLINSIRPAGTNKGAVVRVSATRKGYAYPRLYEYGGRDVQIVRGGATRIKNRSKRGAALRRTGLSALGTHGQFGPRAFLGPALEIERPKVIERVEQMLERIGKDNGF